MVRLTCKVHAFKLKVLTGGSLSETMAIWLSIFSTCNGEDMSCSYGGAGSQLEITEASNGHVIGHFVLNT